MRAEAGVTINGLVRWLAGRGLAGLEAWAGTPGTVGGAICGNAHFQGRLISEHVRSVRVLQPSGEVVDVPAEAMGFGYDRSRIQDSGEVVLSVLFAVTPGAAPEVLRAAARTSLAFRKRTQPLHQSSAGCIFQNPGADVPVPAGVPRSAGALIDRAGLKGAQEGGAAVSALHANFIVVAPGSRAADVRALVDAAARPSSTPAACAWTRRSSTSATGTIHGKVSADMSVLRVQGGRRLEGVVTVEGNKNAALPLIVASLLTTEPVTLHNVPRIRDVDVLLDLLQGLGSTVEGRGTSTLVLRGADRPGATPDAQLVGRVRASMLLMGPLLARCGQVHLAPPGGDFPSRRTLSTHVQALTALGARPIEGAAHAFEAPDGLRGASFYLDEASVTATELALLAAVTAHGETEIRHAATEPHVVELCALLIGDGRADRGRRVVAAARPWRVAACVGRPTRCAATTSKPGPGR